MHARKTVLDVLLGAVFACVSAVAVFSGCVKASESPVFKFFGVSAYINQNGTLLANEKWTVDLDTVKGGDYKKVSRRQSFPAGTNVTEFTLLDSSASLEAFYPSGFTVESYLSHGYKGFELFYYFQETQDGYDVNFEWGFVVPKDTKGDIEITYSYRIDCLPQSLTVGQMLLWDFFTPYECPQIDKFDIQIENYTKVIGNTAYTQYLHAKATNTLNTRSTDSFVFSGEKVSEGTGLGVLLLSKSAAYLKPNPKVSAFSYSDVIESEAKTKADYDSAAHQKRAENARIIAGAVAIFVTLISLFTLFNVYCARGYLFRKKGDEPPPTEGRSFGDAAYRAYAKLPRSGGLKNLLFGVYDVWRTYIYGTGGGLAITASELKSRGILSVARSARGAVISILPHTDAEEEGMSHPEKKLIRVLRLADVNGKEITAEKLKYAADVRRGFAYKHLAEFASDMFSELDLNTDKRLPKAAFAELIIVISGIVLSAVAFVTGIFHPLIPLSIFVSLLIGLFLIPSRPPLSEKGYGTLKRVKSAPPNESGEAAELEALFNGFLAEIRKKEDSAGGAVLSL